MASWDTANEHSELRKALCVIVETKGSTPRKIGAKMLVYENGVTQGTIGGGNLEKEVIHNAIDQIKTGIPKLFKHDLLHQHGMCCGGTVFIYIEPIMEPNRLIIFGAGHTGEALAKHAVSMGFEIFVIDDRKEYLDQIQIEGVNKLEAKYDKVLPTLTFNDRTFIAIMTYEHSYDREILAFCMNKPYAYLGMIGSQRKVELTKKMFIEAQLCTPEAIARVDMPMGLNIKAEGPEEIAISILAKLISVKNDL